MCWEERKKSWEDSLLTFIKEMKHFNSQCLRSQSTKKKSSTIFISLNIDNQSILKEINPEYSLEGLILKLKLQNFGHLMQRSDSLERPLMLGKIEDKRRRRWQSTIWRDGITDSIDMSLSKLWVTVKTGNPGVLRFLGSQSVRQDWVTEQQQTFTTHSVTGFLTKQIYNGYRKMS